MIDRLQDALRPTRALLRGRVASNDAVCRDHHWMKIEVRDFAPARCGQFVALGSGIGLDDFSGEVVHDWSDEHPPTLETLNTSDRDALLRRPFSLAGATYAPDGLATLDVLYQVVGVGTRWLSHRRAGDAITLAGPLGNGFDLDACRSTALLVAGGIGLPPMIWLAEALRQAGRQVNAFCGARTRALLPLRPLDRRSPTSDPTSPTIAWREFAQTPTVVASDDGSIGAPGFVTAALQCWWDHHRPRGNDVTVFTCGPEPMIRAAAALAESRGAACQVCMEQWMACGIGTCQSCVLKVREPDDPQGWRYALCCTEGPVFDSRQILWA